MAYVDYSDPEVRERVAREHPWIDLSDTLVAYRAKIVRCVIDDVREIARQQRGTSYEPCIGSVVCDVFGVTRICDCPRFHTRGLSPCQNLTHPLGYMGQRTFYTRTRIGRHIAATADFDWFAREKQCVLRVGSEGCCGHLRDDWSLFCKRHTCKDCRPTSYVVEEQRRWFYEAVKCLYLLPIGKDVIRRVIVPMLQSRFVKHKGKGHIVSGQDWEQKKGKKGSPPMTILKGICAHNVCPALRVTCQSSNPSARCVVRMNPASDGDIPICKECKRLVSLRSDSTNQHKQKI